MALAVAQSAVKADQAPIRFTDAVGRIFSFPWDICKTWKGMEGLIRVAFLHVDDLSDIVQQGRYDLNGVDGEIILPQVWDMIISPGAEVFMLMWPIPEPDSRAPRTMRDRLAGDDALSNDLGMLDFASSGRDPSQGFGVVLPEDHGLEEGSGNDHKAITVTTSSGHISEFYENESRGKDAYNNQPTDHESEQDAHSHDLAKCNSFPGSSMCRLSVSETLHEPASVI